MVRRQLAILPRPRQLLAKACGGDDEEHDGVDRVGDLDDVLALGGAGREALEPVVGEAGRVGPHRLVEVFAEGGACERGKKTLDKLDDEVYAGSRYLTCLRPCGAYASRRRWWRPGWGRTIPRPARSCAWVSHRPAKWHSAGSDCPTL